MRVRQFLGDLKNDLACMGRVLRHNHSVQLVLVLSLLPWAVSIYRHRDPGVWVPLAEIYGVMAGYWFLTRGARTETLPVRRPRLESLLVLLLVLVWVLYRVAEYWHLLTFPPVQTAICPDLQDTIIPKMIEMMLVPLGLFLVLRYTLPQIGLGLPRWSLIPAAVPIVIYVGWGLSHQPPQGFASRTSCFYLGAGLPEEFLFRALLLSRLQAWIKNAPWALFLSAAVFGVTHIPINLHGADPINLPGALESAFTFQMGIGLAMGFAFQRRTNIWPLSILHALVDAAP